MCEQFKADFVNKIIDVLDSDVINSLKQYYNITVRPCAFKNEYAQCNKIYVSGPRDPDIVCKLCEKSLCKWCTKYKSTGWAYHHNLYCISCFFKNTKLKSMMFPKHICELCLSKKAKIYEAITNLNIHHTNTLDMTITSNIYYCKNCNSLNSAM